MARERGIRARLDGPLRSGPGLFLAVTVAYLALAQLVVWLNDPVAAGAGLWPASGVTLGALLLSPRRRWGWVVAAVVVAEMAGDLAHGYGFWASAGWTLGNVVEPLVGASLLRRTGNPRGLLTPVPNLLRFIALAVLAGPVVGASIGSATTALAFDMPLSQVWPKYVVGDALGVLVVGPAVLALRSRPTVFRLRRPGAEAIALVLVSLLMCALVFGDWASHWMSTMPYLLMPCLSWAALRFGMGGVAWLGLTITLIGNAATAYGGGPFARAGGPSGQSITMLQVFLGISVVSALLLAAVADHLTEQRDIGARWRHQARHDPLTGLVNRSALEELLAELSSAVTWRPVSLVMCDVDKLKVVNDTWGHAAGDELLQAVAARLRAAVRPDDVVARISGDEFVLVLHGADTAQAQEVAHRVLDSVRTPVLLASGDLVAPSVSMGVVMHRPGERAAKLMSRADESMYAAKSLGGGYVTSGTGSDSRP